MGNKGNKWKPTRRVEDIEGDICMENTIPIITMSTVKNEQVYCCGNCGGTLEEPDPLQESTPLLWKSQLFENDSITVGGALSKVLKTKFPEENMERCTLCPECLEILRDLYSLWNCFVSKTCNSSVLYQCWEEDNMNYTYTGWNRPLILESRSVKTTLEERIARRRQATHENGLRRSKRRRFHNTSSASDFDFEGSLEMGTEDCDEVMSPFAPELDIDSQFDVKESTTFNNVDLEKNDLPPHIMQPITSELSSINLPKIKGQRGRGRPKGGKTKKGSPETRPTSDVLQDDVEVQIARRSLRKEGSRTLGAFLSEDGFSSDDKEKQSDESDGSDYDPEGEEEKEIALEKKVSYHQRLIRRDKEEAASERQKTGQISKKFICDECGRRFHRDVGLIKHVNSIHSNVHGPFVCDMENCGKTFSCRTELQKHMNKHLGVKPFICDQCGWSTTGEGLLRNHLRIHLKPEEKEEMKTKVCHICGAKFMKGVALKSHMAVHSDDRPFHCPYEGCQSKFKLLTRLRLHKKQSHSDIKKYPCERCGREFNRKDNLTAHMQVHEKYDLNGGKMRKSRDPPAYNKTVIKIDALELPNPGPGRPCSSNVNNSENLVVP